MLVKVPRIEAIEPLEGKVSPRSMQDHTQGTEPSGHSRYIAARAHRTEILAQMAEIELAATKRDMIPRGEVERAFALAGQMIKAHILRLPADSRTRESVTTFKAGWSGWPSETAPQLVPGFCSKVSSRAGLPSSARPAQILSHGKGGCGAIEKSLLSVTF